MALAGRGRQSFQEAEAAVAPCKHSCRDDLNLAALPYKSNLLPVCEKIFIAARLAASAAFLFCVLPAGASDASGAAQPKIEAQASNSASSISPPQPSDEGKTKKSDKYDIDRIGNRGIGDGVNLYSLQKERALGESMAAAIDRQTKLVADPDLNDYVNLLGQKLVRNSDAEVPFTIKVIDSPELKAFSLPGGFLYVDKGLIMEVDSEAELAGLMAHEIAHVAARHATRSATRRHAWNMVSIPLSRLGGPAGLGIEQIIPLTFKKFSRDAEIEADLLGLEYMYAAGYDPQAFLEALEKLHSKEAQAHARLAKALPAVNFLAKVPLHNQVAHAFSYYPPIEERIQKAQSEISTLLPSREDYVVDTSEFQIVKARLAWADRPILRRHRSGEGVTNGPVLRRHPPDEAQSEQVARFATSQPRKDSTLRAAVPPSL